MSAGPAPAAGTIETDYTEFNIGKAYPITAAGMAAAKAKIAADTATPPVYDIYGLNCTQWALDVAKAAGVTINATRDELITTNNIDNIGPPQVATPGLLGSDFQLGGPGVPIN